ncbi:MAG: hypothetical protein O7H41_11395 [Planctomycetota bacterium]|nr:hypothetical protein [Planctomycetota bacterium]
MHASFSKKIPAEAQYSSKSFHASLEVEVADEIANDGPKLQDRLRALWRDLERAVELQIEESNGNGAPSPERLSSESSPNGQDRASSKQVNYLMLLARRAKGWGLPELQKYVKTRVGDVGLYEMSKQDASMLIEEFRAMKPAENAGRGARR